MNDKNDIFYTIKIKFSKKTHTLLENFMNCLKKTSIVCTKENSDELKIECLTEEDFSLFSTFLSTYICNGFVLATLLDIGKKEKMGQQRLDAFMKQFFSLFKSDMAYFHMLTQIDIKRYLKTNNVLDVQRYWRYNLASMNKDLQNIFHDENKKKLLYTTLKTAFDENYDLLVSTAEVIRTKVLEEKKDFKSPEQIEVSLDENDNLQILDSKTNSNLNSILSSKNIEKFIDFGSFSIASNIILMILIVEPQKAIIYDGFDDDTFDILYDFIADCGDILADRKIEIYFSDDDPLSY